MVFLAGDGPSHLFCCKGDLLAAPTAGDGEEVGLPGDDVEHAPYGDAGKCAVEAAQAEVDGVEGGCEGESCERRQTPCWVCACGGGRGFP